MAFYEIEGEGEEAKLGACSKLIETGRGKFGMEVRYVSVANFKHGHEVGARPADAHALDRVPTVAHSPSEPRPATSPSSTSQRNLSWRRITVMRCVFAR